MLDGCSLARGGCVALLFVAGCSSDGSSQSQSTQLQQLCVNICSKHAHCGDAGASTGSCNADCAQAGSQDGLAPGCNVNELIVAENTCLEDSCSGYASCLEQAVANAACAATGSPSTSEDGGATCSQCDQAMTCCAALNELFGETDASSCMGFTTAACNADEAGSSTFAADCQLQLIVGQDYGVAACN